MSFHSPQPLPLVYAHYKVYNHGTIVKQARVGLKKRSRYMSTKGDKNISILNINRSK